MADPAVVYASYDGEAQLGPLMALLQEDLSEPYSIYTYRYFIYNWPQLCKLALCDGKIVGGIVCKLSKHKSGNFRGYIAMIAVDKAFRRRGIGKTLALQAVQHLKELKADEVVLETEISNTSAILLYESLGFVRDKYLNRYYLNGSDAIRLKLWFPSGDEEGPSAAA